MNKIFLLSALLVLQVSLAVPVAARGHHAPRGPIISLLHTSSTSDEGGAKVHTFTGTVTAPNPCYTVAVSALPVKEGGEGDGGALLVSVHATLVQPPPTVMCADVITELPMEVVYTTADAGRAVMLTSLYVNDIPRKFTVSEPEVPAAEPEAPTTTAAPVETVHVIDTWSAGGNHVFSGSVRAPAGCAVNSVSVATLKGNAKTVEIDIGYGCDTVAPTQVDIPFRATFAAPEHVQVWSITVNGVGMPYDVTRQTSGTVV